MKHQQPETTHKCAADMTVEEFKQELRRIKEKARFVPELQATPASRSYMSKKLMDKINKNKRKAKKNGKATD